MDKELQKESNDKRIRSFEASDKRIILSDHSVGGLTVRIYPSGKRVSIQHTDGMIKIHDLRHIVITGMISLRIDMVHVGKTVAHKELGKKAGIEPVELSFK